jgi:hypothetical protein
MLPLILTSMVGATSFHHPLSLEELGERSEHVVHAEVSAVEQEMRDGLPWTLVTLQVEDSLKGPDTPILTLAYPGGMLPDDVEYRVVGTPKLKEGEEVVAFVRGGKPVALAQGVLRVQDEDHLWTAQGLNFHEGELAPFYAMDDLRQALAPQLAGNADSSATTEQARACINNQVTESYQSGWRVRSVSAFEVTEDDSQYMMLDLVGEVEYRFVGCGDELAQSLRLVVYDDTGQLVESTGPDGQGLEGRQAEMGFMTPDSGTYFVGVHLLSTNEVSTAGIGLGILYR